MVNQLYRPKTDVISVVDDADWLNTRSIEYIDDVIAQTDKELDDALWYGDDTRAAHLKKELESLYLSKELGEEYITSW